MASFLFLLFFFFFFHLSLADHASYNNITLGTTLTPLTKPTSWLSPSGDFAFGFHPHPANNSLSLLAIWFDKMDNKTIVWCANGDAPVVAAESYNLTLSPDGRFSLKDPSGQEIWNPPGVNKFSHAAILDTGNLVLSTADGTVLWQSFDHPTDTILPGQTLKQETQVFARLMDTDYTRGRFVLVLQGSDGNLVMYPVAFPTTMYYDPYWSSDIYGAGVYQVMYNQSGIIGVSYNNTFHVIFSTDVPSDHYHRATLDPDGIFRQYAFPKNKPTAGSWMVKQTLASDICTKLTRTGSGACGFNSYCTMGQDERVDCLCAAHYSFIDNDRKYQGCKPNFVAQSCEPGGESSFDFQVVDNLDWPLADAEHYNPMNETECRINCLKDCFCAVAIYNNGSCWKKKYPLSNGKLDINVNRRALIKYSTVLSSSAQPEEEGKRDWKIWAIGGASLFLLVSVILNLALLAACLLVRSKRTLVRTSSGMAGPALCSFTYKELEDATKGFSEELGRGAFGTVYKGTLVSDSEVLIAVKKLESMSELEAAEKDFMNEIHTIGLTHHKNLVRLLGFCKEGTHRLLVYEFMSNGSLNKFLFRGSTTSPDWNQRIEIALGIARGLAYLHEECRTQIIHCDIKPQNILVDDNLVAKISDFGLAKLLRLDQTRTSTGIRGTIGYFAPEWFKNSAITAKVDVYSFGVLLLEIICCRKNLDWDSGFGSEVKPTLIDCTKECYRTGRLNLLVEEDEEAMKDGMRLERFAMVGISCIQEEPWMRPSMKKVVQMLEGTIEVAIPPNMYSLRM